VQLRAMLAKMQSVSWEWLSVEREFGDEDNGSQKPII
jgi:hypothetical protein